MATAIGVGGLLLGGYSIYSGRKAAKKAEGTQNEQTAKRALVDAEYAANIKEQAEYEAKKIRGEAVRIRGTQVAQQAASGVLVGNGSTAAMVDETVRLAEEDAYITLYNGEKGFLQSMEQGRLNAMEGRARADSYAAQGRASLLSGASSLALNTYQMFK